jgi:hypothetical protein
MLERAQAAECLGVSTYRRPRTPLQMCMDPILYFFAWRATSVQYRLDFAQRASTLSHGIRQSP